MTKHLDRIVASSFVIFACAQAFGCSDTPRTNVNPTILGTRPELADQAALDSMRVPLRTPVFGEGKYFQTGSYDRETGAPAPAAFVKNGNRDMNHFACRGAAGSVSEAQIVPILYDVETCPESYVQGVALARIEGSGRMVRLWMTASSLRHGAVANDEVLRIWVDDDANPVVEEPLAAIIDGSAGEMFAPPFGDGPSDHVAWYYPVVFSKKLVVGLDNLGPLEYYYHQESLVLDAKATDRHASADRLALRNAIIEELRSSGAKTSVGQNLIEPMTVTLMPGQTQQIVELAGAKTIQTIRISVAKATLPDLAKVSWQITWDDENTPAISLSMADFFVATLEPPPAGNASLGLAGFEEADLVQLEFRLPMPFTKNSRFVVGNKNANSVDFGLTLLGTSEVPMEPFGHLSIERRESVKPALGKTHLLANVNGRGKWAGTCMMLEGRGIEDGTLFDEPLNFLEGDELGSLDGQLAIRGTGTEDYFNGAFYFEAGDHASPFAQWWGTRVNDLVGQTNACRFHVLGDAIDFAQNASLELEIGPGIPETLERYRTMTYLYR